MDTSNSDDQIREIETLINSKSKADKSLAYSTLLHFQAQSSEIPSSIETLAATSSRLVSLIVADVTDDDEEIAAQALKCLGFMIYHPSLVNSISGDVAGLVLEVLTNVILTTKIKSVCNLGAWCISMQQFSEACLGFYFDSVLRAVVHALDNPFGSLSTTFEAIQAVTKLAVQASDKMRETSYIWAPPIYRRLLSVDKRERDICHRCLLKIKSSIFPPPLALSKAVVQDMKQKLLTQMKDQLDQGMKVRTLQAWGWFVRLLGSYAMKNRSLMNDLLKIPEQTFSDQNPQVQIASQAAWEGPVDALIGPASLTRESNNTFEKSVQPVQTSVGSGGQIEMARFLKRVKLIMTPFLGVISSKCDVSVHSSCLNTWYYLLHKLDTSVNDPLVIDLVLEPICQIVFQIGPASKTLWFWAFCLDLLDDFVLTKSRSVDVGSSSGRSLRAFVENSTVGSSASTNCLYKQHYVRWLAWDINQLDFFVKMINIIFSHALIAANSTKIRNTACDAALRIFRSLLKGLQLEFKSQTVDYKEVLLGLNKVLSFLKRICDCVNLEGCSNSEVYIASAHFLDVVIEELEPFILESPLYKLALDLSWIENLQSINEARYYGTLNFTPITYMGMVSPLIYVLVLYIGLVLRSTAIAKMTELVVNGVQKLLKFVSLSCNPVENIRVILYVLYKHVGYQNLQIWVVIAQGLRDCFNCVKLLELESGSVCYLNIYHLLSYPFIVVTSTQKKLASQGVCGYMERDHAVSETKVELTDVTEIWKLLYAFSSKFKCSTAISFHEEVCSMLNACIDDNANTFGRNIDLSCKDFALDLLTLLGSAVTCVLEQVILLAESSSENQNNEASNTKTLVIIESSLGLTSRFLKLSWERGRAGLPSGFAISRVFFALAHLVRVLHVQQTIVKLIEVMTCPLLSWLSHGKTHDKSTDDRVTELWTEILNCLTRSQPPIVFDTAFLKLQAPLLKKTLNHQNSNISEPTVAFWNSTYGEQINLDYPESLLDLLDKLFRSRKINLQKKSLPFFIKCNSTPEHASQMYRATATSNRSSKRVGLAGNTPNQHDHAADNESSSSKRRRLELTEHQKEVRLAQQGRRMDSNGHGPGIRTYTSVDFSQGNEDSQE